MAAPTATSDVASGGTLSAEKLEAAIASATANNHGPSDDCWDGPPSARFLNLAAACPEWSACLKARFQSSNARLKREEVVSYDDTDDEENDLACGEHDGHDEVGGGDDAGRPQPVFPMDSVLLAAWEVAAAAVPSPASSDGRGTQQALQPHLGAPAVPAPAEGGLPTEGSCGESCQSTSPMNCSARTANGDGGTATAAQPAPDADSAGTNGSANCADGANASEGSNAPVGAAGDEQPRSRNDEDDANLASSGHHANNSADGHEDDDEDTIRMVSSSSMSEDMTAPPVALRRTSSAATDPALSAQRLKLQSSVRGLVSRRLQPPLLVSYVTGARHPMIGFAAVLASEERKFREAHPDVNHESLLASTADIPKVSSDSAALAAAARTYNNEATVVFNARQRAVPRSVRFSGSQLDASVLSATASVDGDSSNVKAEPNKSSPPK